jgi:hypothetical protein
MLCFRRQTYLINNINNKLVEENAVVTKADKGITIVIIYTKDYNNKVHNFLTDNSFQQIPKDPTNK